MSRTWKSRVGVLALTATMGIGLVGIASPAGAAEDAAKASCKNDGWKTLVRADKTPFKNQGDCVSYAAKGGTPAPPKSASQLLCESYGGTFVVGTGTIAWDCNETPQPPSQGEKFLALWDACRADGGSAFAATNPNPFIPPDSYRCFLPA
jgi:hypothetical protein